MSESAVAAYQSLGALRVDTTTDNKAECFHSLHDPVFKGLSSAIKEAIFGKSLLVISKPFDKLLKSITRQVKYNARILSHSFSARTFLLLLTFLVGNGSSVSFFSALWSRTLSLSSGSYIVSQVTLVGLTGDCYCCCYILMQLFSA